MLVHVRRMEKNLEQQVFPSRGNKHDVLTHDMQGDDKQQQHHQAHNQLPFSGYYNVNIRFDPISPEAGKTTELTLSVTDQKLGDSIREFELLHDKLMHVIIVGEDLSYFAHIHPMIKDGNDNDTTFTITHIFPEPGKYKLWVDFKPKGGNQIIAAFKFNVTGQPIHRPEELVHDGKYTKQSLDGQYQIGLKIPDTNVAQNNVDIAFSISDILGRPTTNLEPLMAAGGHSVIISSDLKEFLHVHPAEEVDPNWRGGPDISFKTSFPKPGLYKAWGQFRMSNKRAEIIIIIIIPVLSHFILFY
jgi:hypothetical protein